MVKAVEIIIDGVECGGKAGEMVLDVARAHGFGIPTLCHHAGLKPYGACRLCLVEVIRGGPIGLQSSCTLPVAAGLELYSASEPVMKSRRMVMQLLLGRTPQVPEIQKLAAGLGVQPGSDATSEERCVLCGRCVRACAQIGAYAIGFAGRGIHRRVTTPFKQFPRTCLACRACFHVCPTGAIESTLGLDRIQMSLPDVPPWELETVPCSRCGKRSVTNGTWDHVQARQPVGIRGAKPVCPACRRADFVKRLGDGCG
jgi:bidirectional [NiFe] hydrogenase diaphorase subunit